MNTNVLSQDRTIAQAEELIQQGLERLRDAPMNEIITSALAFVAPAGYRVVVQLEEDGRKKRSSASISNWNHATGEIVMFFEPIEAGGKLIQAIPTPDATKSSEPSRSEIRLSSPLVSTTNANLANTPEDELRECCEALAEAEKQGRHFYAIKWFRDSFLLEKPYSWIGSVPERQRVLNRAIQEGYIETHTVPNPKNPAHPTTALQLNRQKSASIVPPRFRPVPILGRPLSQTIIDDRGSY